MSAKSKKNKITTHYFSEARDYSKVAEVEAAFFRGLVDARSQFPPNESLQSSIRKMPNFIQEPNGRELEFTVEFDVLDLRKGIPQKIFLGTRLSPPKSESDAEATHFLCLADDECLLAKFHADFDFKLHADEKKPSPQVQIGGRIPPALKGRYTKHCWHADVNKPRIPTLPICTALLWQWAFLEYHDDPLFAQFLGNRWWNKLIKDAESTVLSPFFDDGARFLKTHPEKGFLNALYVPISK